MWIEFNGLRAKECIEAAGISYLNPVYSPDSQEHAFEIGEEMQELVFRENSSSMEMIGRFYLLMDKLIRYSNTRKKRQEGRMSDFYAKEAISFISEHYAQDITVEDIAKSCRLDRSYFGKIFKNVIGQSPQEFLVHYRMAKAAELLTTSDDPVSDVGAAVGYPNALHFSRAFKRIYKMAPREYRQIHRIIR